MCLVWFRSRCSAVQQERMVDLSDLKRHLRSWRGHSWGWMYIYIFSHNCSWRSLIISILLQSICILSIFVWLRPLSLIGHWFVEFRGRNSQLVGVNVTPGISVDRGISWDRVYPGVIVVIYVFIILESHSCDPFWVSAVSSFYGKFGRCRRWARYRCFTLDIDVIWVDIT